MKNRNKALIGFILILVGLVLLGQQFGWYWFDFSDMIPLLLIGIGVWMIIRRRKIEIEMKATSDSEPDIHVHRKPPSPEPPPSPSDFDDFASRQADQSASAFTNQAGDSTQSERFASEAPSEDRNGRLKYSKFIGDMEIDLRNRSFQDIEVSLFIGDVKLNLTGVQLNKGLNRIVVSGFISDFKVYVPKGMAVFANCSNFIGDIEACGRKSSSIGNNIECQTDNYTTAEEKVYIAVNSFAGDIKIIEQ